MSRSALTGHGVTQELSGAALDVFTETIRLDTDLITFHGGSKDAVRIAQGDIPWEEIAPWSVVTTSLGFETSGDRVGGAVEGLRLRAWFIWPEPSSFRDLGEAGFADLDHKVRIAIEGGKNAAGTVVPGNPGLAWRNAWVGSPPAGFVGVVETNTAANGLISGPLPSAHTTLEVALQGLDSCIVQALAFDAVFGVVRSRC